MSLGASIDEKGGSCLLRRGRFDIRLGIKIDETEGTLGSVPIGTDTE